MLPLVEFPELVKHYGSFLEEVFSEAAFIEFERYISGLLVSENKKTARWAGRAVVPPGRLRKGEDDESYTASFVQEFSPLAARIHTEDHNR